MESRFSKNELDRLAIISQYISNNLDQPLRLPDLCARAYMNRHRLNKGFQKLYKQGLFSYIRKQRMEKALKLLQETENSIQEIAEAVGYDYPTNFLTAFKNYYGITAHTARRNGSI